MRVLEKVCTGLVISVVSMATLVWLGVESPYVGIMAGAATCAYILTTK